MMTSADIKEEAEAVDETKVLLVDGSESEMYEKGNIIKYTKKRLKNPKCNQCDHVAKNSRSLKMHMDAIHKGVVFMCDQCDYSSRHKCNLNSHQKSKHEMRVYRCLHCDVTTSFKQYLQKHMKEKHGGQMVYFCSDCDYCNEDKQEYTIHKRTVHVPIKKTRDIKYLKEDPLSSKDMSKTEVFLVEPKIENALKLFPCDRCDYSTDRKHNLTLHNKAVHENSVDFYCEACPFSTTTKGYLQRHATLMHKEIVSKLRRSYPLFTPITELPEHKFFNTSGNRLPLLYIQGFSLKMNKYFLNDKEEKCAYFYCANKDKNKCKVSAKAFVENEDVIEPEMIIDKEEVSEETSDPLSEVVNTENTNNKEETEDSLGMTLISYQGIHTDKCTKSSPEELLNKRMKKHDLKCDLCEYESTSVGGLEKHRQVKHDKVTYSCDQCDFHVKYKSSLRRHIQAIHEGKAFLCSFCDHKSTAASHLRTHVESQHEGIRYGCDTCGKQFKQKIHLKVHDDTMHKGITYSCTYCPYVARQKGHLNHHIRTIHLGQPHKCDICGIIYAHNGQLKVHKVRDHSDESVNAKFKCDNCNFFTNREIYLRRHIQRRHEGKEIKRRKSKGPKRKSTKTSDTSSSPVEDTLYLKIELTETKPAIDNIDVIETQLDEELLLEGKEIKRRKSIGPKRKNKKKDTETGETSSSPVEDALYLEFTEAKPAIDNIDVIETKLEEELLLDEDFIAETKFSVQINRS